MNGDILTDLDYAAFYDDHVRSGVSFTISSHQREQAIDYGVIDTFEGTLINLREKPKLNYEVSMGVYMASRAVLEHIPPTGAFGFDQLMHAMIRAAAPVNVRRFAGYWLDIGRPDDYKAASDIFEKNQHVFLGSA
jgi:NDP-sugar pyrophosphorylase family protein